MDQTDPRERARKMSVAIVDQDAVAGFEYERLVVYEKFDRRYSATGLREITSHWKAFVNYLLWVRRLAVASNE